MVAIINVLNRKFPDASSWRVCVELASNYCQLVLASDCATECEDPNKNKQCIKYRVGYDKADGDARVKKKKRNAWKRGEGNVLDGE